MKGFVHSGHLVGLQTFFNVDGSFLNMTDSRTGYIHLRQWTFKGHSITIFGCENTKDGERCNIMDKDQGYRVTRFEINGFVNEKLW